MAGRRPPRRRSFAALTTALALTDGASEKPIGGSTVLRLGPPGSTLAVSRPDRLVLASTRDGLRAALDHPIELDPGPGQAYPSGWHARLDPAGLRGLRSVAGRRLAEGLAVAGLGRFEAD